MDIRAIFNSIITFILALYAESSYPRKIIQEFVDHMGHFIKNVFLMSLKHDILKILNQNDKISEASLLAIDTCFDKYGDVYKSVSTEYKRLEIKKKMGYIDFEKFSLGYTFIYKIVNNEKLIVPEYMYGVYVPLRRSLKSFLEISGIFNKILLYMQQLKKESYIISNIIQSQTWKNKYANIFKNEIVLPLYLFFDDLEVGNALGSNAGKNKFGAIYISIACLPPQIASRLSSILFCALIRSADKKNTTNKKIFSKIIDELNYLQTQGIELNINGTKKTVKFQLVLIVGDNLGLNGICEFVESFKANFCCRICSINSEDLGTTSKENVSLLRNKISYKADVEAKNLSKTGVKEECVFNAVNGFHITENISIDMMHDVLEGVCMYIMRGMIFYFIFTKKHFTLEQMNDIIENFEYGHESNKPPKIALNRLKQKIDLKMSAAEMLCFERYFGLMFGNLVPEGEKHWKLYIFLRKIIHIITSPRIIPSYVLQLTHLIMELNNMYIRLFGKLKPKFHFLIHYPRLLLLNGPCIHYWTMRFESRYKEMKSNALASNCSINYNS